MRVTRFAVFTALLLVAASLEATTIVMPSDDQLVAKSPLIVVARVLASTPVELYGGVWTETTLQVERVIRGTSVSATLQVREIGGRTAALTTVIYGAPDYRRGERVLAFLLPTPRGDYQTVDLFVGKFTERRTTDGKVLWYREDGATGTRLLGEDLTAFRASDAQRDAAKFEAWIAARLGGEEAQPDYLIADPRLQAISADFTLISEPTIYRWFAFQNGSSVSWRSVGQQSGYGTGGVSELQTAMGAWSGYGGAAIRYLYAGATTTAGGLNRPNGVNEVLFNDALNEVGGSWDPAVGGVVGVGGFNSVSPGPSWTSTFEADPSHPARTFEATFDIREGNLVIQDGVSPANGISSFTLSEIISHEFGHTLGIGHSADRSALMYYQITGGGPSLKGDDQTAARWLYGTGGGGGGGGGETVPPAPSALTATIVSDTAVQLNWTDNASNETMQTVYVRVGNAAFTRYNDVQPNLRAYAITNLTRGQTYRFEITASNAAGESPPSNVAEVKLPSDVPVAAFSVNPVNGVAGVTKFTFTDQSSGNIVSRSWSFGDGATSEEAKPTHVYSSPGNYSVQLGVASASGARSYATRNIIVTAPSVPPSAAFSFTPLAPSVIDTVSFVDETTGYAQTWVWDFGDGSTSELQNPSHRYATPGTYTVKLVASGNGGSSSANKSITVSAGSGGSTIVEAKFDIAVVSPTTDQTVSFYDRSLGLPNSWYWDFGDGYISTKQNPSHRFQKPGTFTISLTAGNLGSSSKTTKSITVRPPQAIFSAIIPVAAETAGSGGSSWRTELTIFNPEDVPANVTLQYLSQVSSLPSGGTPTPKSVVVPARSTATWSNALRDLFNVTSGAAAIAIEATTAASAPKLRVASRTFTTGADGTYGQFVPDVTTLDVPRTTYLVGLQSNKSFRTNIGLVNGGEVPAEVELLLFAADGSLIAATTQSLPGGSLQQSPLTTLFSAAKGELSSLSLKINASTGSVRAYASVVDNISQDPIYVPSTVPIDGQELVIPAVARASGGSSTFWRSDVALFNPSSTPLALSLRLLRSGADNRNAASRSLIVPSGQTMTINDVVTWLSAGSASGALELTWTGTSAPVVTSRTYTVRASDGGSFGQSIGASPVALNRGEQYVTGLRADASYRSNVGLLNHATEPATATLTLLDSEGRNLGSTTVALEPKSQLQLALGTLFAGVGTEHLGIFTVRLKEGGDFLLYGSVVDNRSGDPVFMNGK